MADPRNFSPIRAFFLSSYRVNIARCNLCARAKVKGHIKLKIEENTSVVKSKLNLHLYITGSFYTVVFLYRIFFLVSYISVMNLANCLTFGSVIIDSISFMVWLAVWSKSNCRLSA